jgi:exo-beta-1,3-glucanase (GH17 family)
VAGGYAGYTHHWSASYRSTVSGGLSWTERGADPVSSHARTTYVSANLIWDVLTDVSVGGEVLYGGNDRGAGRSADMARLMLSAQYRFGG